MKKLPAVFAIACCFISYEAICQPCNFVPVIVPDPFLLCPNSTDTLQTSEAYDSYQWYRNNKPIEGANSRYLVLHQQTDLGYYYKVTASLKRCTATSKKVLADGYAFNPPIMIEAGDIGVLDLKRDALIECPRDTILLGLGETYTVNIQWYNHLKPIRNADSQYYYVTHSGSYTVCGAPAVCPDLIACESLPLHVIFEDPVVSITQSHDTLFASPAKRYQWFRNDKKIEGAVQNFYLPFHKGSYTVRAVDKFKCAAISAPYIYSRQEKNIITVLPNPVQDIVHVHVSVPASSAARIIVSDLFGNEILEIPFSGYDKNISLQQLHTGAYMLRLMDDKQQVSGSVKIFKL